MSSRYGGFRVGKGRILNEWDKRKSPSSNASAPTSVLNFDYSTAQGIWNLRSTTQFPKRTGPQFVAGSVGFTASGTSVTVSVPVGAVAGDLLVAIGTTGSATDTFNAVSGWTEQSDANGRLIATLASWNGSTSSYTFGISATRAVRVQILCFRNAAFGVIGTPSASGNDPVAPSITINAANSLWLAVGSSTLSGMTYSVPSGFSDIVAAQSTTISQRIIVSDTLQPIGATSTITFTRTSGADTSRAAQFSIKPI